MTTSNEEELIARVDLAGRRVIDVGCGEGGTVRWMQRQGADAVGVECGAEMLARAHAADPDHPERYVEGVGQDLPFPDATADVVVFFRSLHHVPGDHMAEALAEAHRVLRPGGTLYVLEPEARGSSFEVGRLVDDETEVRALAQAALAAAPSIGFELVDTGVYETLAVYADVGHFEHHMVGIDPARAAAFDRHRDEVERRFVELGEPCVGGRSFVQPHRFAVLRRPTAAAGAGPAGPG